uniref:Uncharacterized protein n=1 Tax=Romanomermis culicivorax TaxID=13658 RepID=A0A915J3G1_ROMCU
PQLLDELKAFENHLSEDKQNDKDADVTSNFYQSMALAAAFAARNGLSSPPASTGIPSFHPEMYPYANPYSLPVPTNCFLPSSSSATTVKTFPPLWLPGASALTNDYLLAMAGNLHNFRAGMSNEQYQQPQSSTNRRSFINITSDNHENHAEESFDEILRKISQMPNNSNTSKTVFIHHGSGVAAMTNQITPPKIDVKYDWLHVTCTEIRLVTTGVP